jgi:uncharacterized membrane protein
MDPNGAQTHTTPDEQEPSPAEALHRLQQQLGELQAYVTHFVNAKIDAYVLSARQLALWVVLGVLALSAGVGLIVTAIVLVLVGAAHGFALLFGGRWWLGALAVGGATLALLALCIIIGVRTWQSRWRQQKVQQYEERQLQQQHTFGRSAADRAAAETALQHQR